ncbi:hypothetical protein EVJ58_g7213, partial [Rhodofomes roseus]
MQEKPTKRPIKRKEASRLVGRAAWNGIARFFSRDGGMPSLAMVLAGDTCYPVRLVYCVEFAAARFLPWRALCPADTQLAGRRADSFHCSVKNFEAYLAYQARTLCGDAAVCGVVPGLPPPLPRPPPHTSGPRPPATPTSPSPSPPPPALQTASAPATPRASLPSSYKLAACVRLPPVDSAVAYPDSAPSLATPNSPLLSQPLRPAPDPVPRDQPFKEECMRIVATFLRPGTAKELPLDAALRDTTIRDLTWNTHPDV